MMFKKKKSLFVLRFIQNKEMLCNQRAAFLKLNLVVRKVTSRL
jgi:hypothetical protein